MVNDKQCPLCKKENFCEADVENNDCWCNRIKVPSALIDLVPVELQRKACICKNCVLLYQFDKEKFMKEIAIKL